MVPPSHVYVFLHVLKRFESQDPTAPDPEEGSPSPKGNCIFIHVLPPTYPFHAAWYQDHGAGASANASGPIGRSWYTSLGHTNQTWEVSANSD